LAAVHFSLATVPAERFVSILPRLRGLMSATRTDHRAWLFDFEQRLVQAGGTEAIVQAITGTDFHLRRAAYLAAIDHRLLSGSEIVKRGLLSVDAIGAIPSDSASSRSTRRIVCPTSRTRDRSVVTGDTMEPCRSVVVTGACQSRTYGGYRSHSRALHDSSAYSLALTCAGM
jgi:hypothetical protein